MDSFHPVLVPTQCHRTKEKCSPGYTSSTGVYLILQEKISFYLSLLNIEQ